MSPSVGAPLLAVGLAVVHLFAGKLRVQDIVPRSLWLSLAGGVSVAYVFVHVLPEITERHLEMASEAEAADTLLAAAREHALFLVLLLGFAGFYGLERLAHYSRGETGRTEITGGGETRTSATVFWIHVGSFAAYNALIGYLLVHRETASDAGLLLYGTAMAFHFVVNDYGLREHHQEAYESVGRWVLAGAVLAGLLVGYLVGVPELFVSLLFALLAGGIILNVIKEELPEDRQSRFWAFAAGLVGYAAVLLAA